MESQLWQRQGKAISNFAQTLPPVQSDLAEQSLKDPYVFDFLSLTETVQERELEQALVKHITDFLLELGAGFAYVGKQVQLSVGGQYFYLDLLFYHLKLWCYVVIELKATDFTPEHAGKLSFYLTAVDRQRKTEQGIDPSYFSLRKRLLLAWKPSTMVGRAGYLLHSCQARDAEKFRQFTVILDTPPTGNAGLERLMAVKAPWENIKA